MICCFPMSSILSDVSLSVSPCISATPVDVTTDLGAVADGDSGGSGGRFRGVLGNTATPDDAIGEAGIEAADIDAERRRVVTFGVALGVALGIVAASFVPRRRRPPPGVVRHPAASFVTRRRRLSPGGVFRHLH